MKAKSAKLGDVGVYAYVCARGGGRTFERGNRRRVGGVGDEWRVGKKGRDVFAESGEVLEKSRLVFSKESPSQLES
mgnify:CR=1 FL=1